ncbi:MAG: signal transduction histidine kinase/ligand-binding sensor domain-containing protein [Phenylobacterium sp.]|jgi:signal transduction histidine kinase/ligand-binding sensor domain-containing protein
MLCLNNPGITDTAKKNNPMRLMIALLILLCTFTALAGGPVIHFDRLSIKDGLSQNTVKSILQDRQGFLWFATEDGLNRYDGYSFKVFRHDPQDPYSISHNFTKTLYEDSKGTLWVGTFGGGLNRFDAEKQRFTRFQHDPSNAHSLSNDNINAIAEDNQGHLWIGTTGGGLNHYDPSSNQFSHYKHQKTDPDSLSHNQVISVFQDSHDNIWVGTTAGLDRYNRKQQSFSHFIHDPTKPFSLSNSLSHNRVKAIAQDTSGTLWVGTEDGLNRFDAKKQHFIPFKLLDSDGHNLGKDLGKDLAKDNIENIYIDSKGSLWVGTWLGGLNQYNAEKQQFNHFDHNHADPYSLSSNTIFALLEDNQGALWIGTDDGGLSKLDTQRQRFGHFKHQPSDPESLSANTVRSIHQDNNGVLWMGTSDGLNQYQAKKQRFVHFKHSATDPGSLSHNRVLSINSDSAGLLWVGTSGGGLSQYNRDSNSFIHFKHQPSNPHSLSHNAVISIFEDSHKALWVGTFGGGLNKYQPEHQRFKRYAHQTTRQGTENHSLSSKIIKTIIEDSQQRLWVTTFDGLNLFDRQTEQFKSYQHQQSNPRSLSHNDVNTIYEDSNGNIWVGTRGGLNLFDDQSDTFTHYREKDGLANDNVFGILEDDSANLWISTFNGLSKFNLASKTFKNFDINDGLQSNEFTFGSHFKSPDGELFFGGINGFNRFLPHTIQDDQQIPDVVLTDFLLANQSVPIEANDPSDKASNKNDDSQFGLPKAINQLELLTLTHKQNLISFEFAALHFANPMKNQYAYKLEGQDDDWITTDAKNRRATYSNLPAGDYTLRIKASNQDGYWNEQGKSLQINVLPPPWKSGWAYSIYLLILAALTLLVVKLINERRKAADEHTMLMQLKQVDKLKDEFLANTSHELRTPLNGIIGLTESLIDGVAGKLPSRANQQLSMVVSSGRRLSNLINDILDFAKLDSHSLTLNQQPVDLHNLTDVVLALSHHLTGDKKLTLTNAIPLDLPAVYADEERLQQILYNLVGNGIKFTDQGSVTVSAERHDNQLKVSISDQGIGIAQDQFEHIFKSFEQVQGSATRRYGGTGLGLAVSKELVNLHGGEIAVESTVGEGSTFSFTLAITDEKPQADSSTNLALHRINQLRRDAEQNSEADDIDQANSDNANNTANNDGTFRLLLVDDEPINRLVLRNHLSAQNYQLVEAGGGEEALHAIDHYGPFDLVLLDIMMPKISGYQVCEKIRETFPVNDLPVIFLTAKNQQIDMLQSFEVGANDYLNKPVAKHELLARIETHLKLLDINRHLEDKVAERTVTLEQKNREIIATQHQMVQSEKMASLGILTAGVAHEINNPTNFVHVSTQNLEIDLARFKKSLLQLASDDADEAILEHFNQQFIPLFKHIDTIKNGTERIKVIVKDLRAFSQLDAADKKSVHITDLLTSTIHLIQTKYFDVAEFVTDFAYSPELECYPAQLNQVFMNLIVNACDAIKEQHLGPQVSLEDRTMGKITIGCCAIKDHPEFQTEIFVTDNGSGMDEETKNKLFEPFYTTKGVDGTGLGLSISFGIVQKHAGELLVESEPGVGTTFRVRLPG